MTQASGFWDSNLHTCAFTLISCLRHPWYILEQILHTWTLIFSRLLDIVMAYQLPKPVSLSYRLNVSIVSPHSSLPSRLRHLTLHHVSLTHSMIYRETTTVPQPIRFSTSHSPIRNFFLASSRVSPLQFLKCWYEYNIIVGTRVYVYLYRGLQCGRSQRRRNLLLHCCSSCSSCSTRNWASVKTSTSSIISLSFIGLGQAQEFGWRSVRCGNAEAAAKGWCRREPASFGETVWKTGPESNGMQSDAMRGARRRDTSAEATSREPSATESTSAAVAVFRLFLRPFSPSRFIRLGSHPL